MKKVLALIRGECFCEWQMSNFDMQYTKKQLQDYRDYERVRKSGRYNMFDPRARQVTGLTGEEYSFVMKHFSELRETAEAAPTKLRPR